MAVVVVLPMQLLFCQIAILQCWLAFTFYSLLIFCVFGNFSCTCGIIQNLYSLGIVIEGIKYDEGLADGGAEHVKSEYAPTLVPTGKHAL